MLYLSSERKKNQFGILYSAKMSLKNESEIKTFSDKQKLSEHQYYNVKWSPLVRKKWCQRTSVSIKRDQELIKIGGKT